MTSGLQGGYLSPCKSHCTPHLSPCKTLRARPGRAAALPLRAKAAPSPQEPAEPQLGQRQSPDVEAQALAGGPAAGKETLRVWFWLWERVRGALTANASCLPRPTELPVPIWGGFGARQGGCKMFTVPCKPCERGDKKAHPPPARAGSRRGEPGNTARRHRERVPFGWGVRGCPSPAGPAAGGAQLEPSQGPAALTCLSHVLSGCAGDGDAGRTSMDAVGEFRLGEEGGQGGRQRLQGRGPAGVHDRARRDPARSLAGSPRSIAGSCVRATLCPLPGTGWDLGQLRGQ